MKKFIPTAEQTARKLERREKFKLLWARVAKMPELERVQLSNKLGIVTVEGKQLSICNQIMLAFQLPGVSIVGGFRQWIKNGRSVRKGEHGAMIWVPCGSKKQDGTEVNAETRIDSEDVHFIIGTVFDIGQTEAINARTDEVITVENVFDVPAVVEKRAPVIVPQVAPLDGMTPLGVTAIEEFKLELF